MGTGGTPEGIISACAIRALGGTFLGRLDPQLATEKIRVREAGISTERWYRLEEMVISPDALFCATGITTGLLVEGVELLGSRYRTQSLMISGTTGERQLLTSWLPATALREGA
jgi:fructose-1,6-bisphosphatase II